MAFKVFNRQPDGLVQLRGEFLPSVGFRAPTAGSPAAAAVQVAFNRLATFDDVRARAEADHDLTAEGRDRRCADAKAAAVTAINEARERIATLVRAREAAEFTLFEPLAVATATDVLLDADIRDRFTHLSDPAQLGLYQEMQRGEEARVLLALVRDPLPNVIRSRAREVRAAVIERDHAAEIAELARHEEDEDRAEAALEAMAVALGGKTTTGGVPPDVQADLAARRERERPVTYWTPAEA